MHEKYDRRDLIRGGAILAAATVLDHIIPSFEDHEYVDLGQYSADVIAHNAANNPLKFKQALQSQIPLVEVDLLETGGKLVTAHNSFEYRLFSPRRRELQDPSFILTEIQKAGKHPFLDLKSSTDSADQIHDLLGDVNSDVESMMSSNNHKLLLSLREKGFKGRILFSISAASSLRLFLDANTAFNYSGDNFGVSIRHNLLWNSLVARRFKDMGFAVAAWSPNTPLEIAKSITNGADIITSDNYGDLERISPLAA